MSIPPGTVAYQLGAIPCTGIGVTWTTEELNSVIEGPVAAVLFDEAGRADLAGILTPLANTEFQQDSIGRVLSLPDVVDDWRVGEAAAESYLSHHRNCYFPWPDGRDERKTRSSLPGADLVGFGSDDMGYCFAFGEVKTSHDSRCPPGVIYGRHGLQQQLEDLRDQESFRDDLMRYLGHRAMTAPWFPRFQCAVKRYLNNSSDIQIFGVLVRDVPPSGKDLCARVRSLGNTCPSGTFIELLAIYLPLARINGIGKLALEKRAGS